MNSWIVCVIALATFYNVLSEVSSASLKTERQAFLKKEVQNLLLEELASELFAKKQDQNPEPTTEKPDKRNEGCEGIRDGCQGCKDNSPIAGFDCAANEGACQECHENGPKGGKTKGKRGLEEELQRILVKELATEILAKKDDDDIPNECADHCDENSGDAQKCGDCLHDKFC